MIPVGDVIPSRTKPWVNGSLLVLGLALFVAVRLLRLGTPLVTTSRLSEPSTAVWVGTLAMFVHRDVLHLLANVSALWVFGNTLEDRLGHKRYLAFFLLAGWTAHVVGSWAHQGASALEIGSSGAVAGVIGAYLALFPRAPILLLVPLVVFTDVVEIPAVVFAVLWFGLQVVNGMSRAPWLFDVWPYIGGAAAGIALSRILRRPERFRVDWWSR